MADPLRHYREIWLVDFEFRCPPGCVPDVHCMVAREFRSGRLIRLWSDQLAELRDPPFPIDSGLSVRGLLRSAEFGCFLALGWPMPARVLDLFTEFRCLTNGLAVPCGNGLLGALAYYGLGAIAAAEKSDMRDLAIRGGPFTPAEREALLDVLSNATLIRWVGYCRPCCRRSTYRGPCYVAATWPRWRRWNTRARRSTSRPSEALRANWGRLKGRLTREIDREYGVYVAGGRVPDERPRRHSVGRCWRSPQTSVVTRTTWPRGGQVRSRLPTRKPCRRFVAAETGRAREDRFDGGRDRTMGERRQGSFDVARSGRAGAGTGRRVSGTGDRPRLFVGRWLRRHRPCRAAVGSAAGSDRQAAPA